MEIKNCTIQDLNQVIDLWKKTDLYLKEVDRKKILEKKIKHDSKSIMVAKEDNKIIGVVCFIYDPHFSIIYHLGVDAKHRNKGIGNRLMDETEKRLKNRGVKYPVLFVTEKNKEVIEFYKKREWFIISKEICMGKDL